MGAETGHVLVAGATGVAAQNLIEVVGASPGWSVTGLCRKPPATAAANVRYVAADLTDLQSCKRAVADIPATHLVYAARASHHLYTAMTPYAKVGIEDPGPNVAMLRNILRACADKPLRHVHALAGTKWYGLHLGPFATPARESDPGHLPPNYYFGQQQLLIEEAARQGWSWSTSRPGVICGGAVGSGPNLLSTLGAYAAICRHLGRPFDFPGKPGAYTSLLEMTDARLLAEAIFWMGNASSAANQAFNVVNGDLFRWEQVWPLLARLFDVQPGRVRHASLVQWMTGKEAVWDEIVTAHGLQPLALDQVASWGFADFVLGWDYDVISSPTKLRKAGFAGFVDTEDMMMSQIKSYREQRIIP